MLTSLATVPIVVIARFVRFIIANAGCLLLARVLAAMLSYFLVVLAMCPAFAIFVALLQSLNVTRIPVIISLLISSVSFSKQIMQLLTLHLL